MARGRQAERGGGLRLGAMRRVAIIGSGGAGKSTLARLLGERSGLPVVHLDRHFWSAGWIEPAPDEWVRTVQRLADEDTWISDGNYGRTMEIRLARADVIVFLDFPRWRCIPRVLRRTWRHRKKQSPRHRGGLSGSRLAGIPALAVALSARHAPEHSRTN